jgi:hypothetical protein
MIFRYDPGAPPDAPRPARADMIAAVIARELNHAPGAPERFRSRAQEEITTAADGNTRVYRIVTPVGTFCRTYPANGSQPMNTTCPR